MYSVGNKTYHYNSEHNKAVKKRFLQREVFTEATRTVEFILEASLSNFESPLRWEYEMDRPTKPFCPFCGEELTLDETDTMDPEVIIHIDETAEEDERYLCPICLSGYATEIDARNCCHYKGIYICEHCHTAVADEDVDYSDEVGNPKEWWLVTDWIAKKLASKNQLVLESEDGVYVWGRMTGDGELLEDDIISGICYDLELLEGQKNYREVKTA